jgi:hypothetical protein
VFELYKSIKELRVHFKYVSGMPTRHPRRMSTSNSSKFLIHSYQESSRWIVSLDVSIVEGRGMGRSTSKEVILPVAKCSCHCREKDRHCIYIRWRSFRGFHDRGNGYISRNDQPPRNNLFCFSVSVVTPGGFPENKEQASEYHTSGRMSIRVSNVWNLCATRPMEGYLKLAYSILIYYQINSIINVQEVPD